MVKTIKVSFHIKFDIWCSLSQAVSIHMPMENWSANSDNKELSINNEFLQSGWPVALGWWSMSAHPFINYCRVLS